MLDSHLVDIFCGASTTVCTCSDAQTNIPYFTAPLKLTMLLGSCCGHLLLHHRAGLRTCLPFKLPTAQLHCPAEVDHVARFLLCWTSSSPPSSSAMYVPTTQTSATSLHRPAEVDHVARILLWTSSSPTSSRAAYVPITRTTRRILHRPSEVTTVLDSHVVDHLLLHFNHRRYVLRHSNAPPLTSRPR